MEFLTGVVIAFVLSLFITLVGRGKKRTLWFVAAALLMHGTFDFFHGHFISNPGVPARWPMFCLAGDVVAAA